MEKRSQILCFAGTRPEAIKMAPVINFLRKEAWARCLVIATAQHRELLDQELISFGIKPDIDLNIMTPDQPLSELTSRLLLKIDPVLTDYMPDAVLAQGDTTTVFTVALACFYRGIPFGHVEAGLRTGDFRNPFPEEFNRVVTSRIAKWNFAPTKRAKQNLIDEGVIEDTIYVTGNTVIDALLTTAGTDKIKAGPTINSDPKLIVVTVHRRENFGEPLRRICYAILQLADQYDAVRFVIPVHPNPNVSKVVHKIIADHPKITLCEPFGYADFVSLLDKAYLILSDSGGLQEEGPALAKPVLVLREKTERPEAVEAGVVRIVGTKTDKIVSETLSLLTDAEAYRDLAKGISPYGDGHAAERIVNILKSDCIKS